MCVRKRNEEKKKNHIISMTHAVCSMLTGQKLLENICCEIHCFSNHDSRSGMKNRITYVHFGCPVIASI